MSTQDNLRIRRTRPLISPAIIAEQTPLQDAQATTVSAARETISKILHGTDPRLLVVAGPCSVHDPAAVMDYAQKLAKLASEVSDHLFVVLRVYFEKPRTTVGWKGFINDPHLDESYDVNFGLSAARQLLSDLTDLGLTCATEFLDTTFGQYFTDYISWGAIGARTCESQIHRQLASGLSMPVGIKNATSGNVDVAIDAIIAANQSHLFPSLTKEGAPALLETNGNPDAHLVLRGGPEPNFATEHTQSAQAKLAARGVGTGIVVDCSHANSQKDPKAQIAIAQNIIEQRQADDSGIVGIMLESHLVEGRQAEPVTYGCSITDACLGWDDTATLLRHINTPKDSPA